MHEYIWFALGVVLGANIGIVAAGLLAASGRMERGES